MGPRLPVRSERLRAPEAASTAGLGEETADAVPRRSLARPPSFPDAGASEAGHSPDDRARLTPSACTSALAEAITSADLETATSCFSPKAGLLVPDGTVVEGRDSIRGVLLQLVAMRIAITVAPYRQVELGELALCSERWQIRQPPAEAGTSRTQTTRSLSLLRFHGGDWKITFLAPWGFD